MQIHNSIPFSTPPCSVPKFIRSQQDIYISTSILPPFPTSVTSSTPPPTSRSPAPSRQILQPLELLTQYLTLIQDQNQGTCHLAMPLPYSIPSYLQASFTINFPTSCLRRLSFFPARYHVSSRLEFHPPFPPILPLPNLLPNPDSTSFNSTGKGNGESTLHLLSPALLPTTQISQVESKPGRM
jgi:hypothetical protein